MATTEQDELKVPLVLVSPTNFYSNTINLRNSATGEQQRHGMPKHQELPLLSDTLILNHPPPPGQRQQQQNQKEQAASVGCARPPAWTGWTLKSLLLPIACLCWAVCSSGAILVNKYLLVDLNFPFPCTVAALGVGSTSLISGLLVRCMRLQQGGSSSSKSKSSQGLLSGGKRVAAGGLLWYTVPAGLCLALSLQLGNAAYLHLSVAYVQMLKSFTPVVTMLFAFLFGLERPSLLLVSSVALMTAGVAVASWGEGALSATGVAVMVGSKVAEALRLVLAQAVLSKRGGINMHPMQALAAISPAATVWMVLIAGSTEALDMWQHGALHDILRHPWVLLASAAAGFCSNAMAMVVISLSGALTLKCIGMGKDVGLVLWSVLALGEVVTPLQGVGYGISLAWFMLFNASKMMLSSRRSRSSSKLRPPSSPGAAAAAANKSGRDSGGVRVDVVLFSPAGHSSSSTSAAAGLMGGQQAMQPAIKTRREQQPPLPEPSTREEQQRLLLV